VKGKVVEIGFSRELHSRTLLTYALVGPGLFCFLIFFLFFFFEFTIDLLIYLVFQMICQMPQISTVLSRAFWGLTLKN
jgi:hypothetical protein